MSPKLSAIATKVRVEIVQSYEKDVSFGSLLKPAQDGRKAGADSKHVPSIQLLIHALSPRPNLTSLSQRSLFFSYFSQVKR